MNTPSVASDTQSAAPAPTPVLLSAPVPLSDLPMNSKLPETHRTLLLAANRLNNAQLFEEVEEDSCCDEDVSSLHPSSASIIFPDPLDTTLTHLSCPFHRYHQCEALLPFTRTRALLDHLKSVHECIVYLPNQVQYSMAPYLSYWASRLDSVQGHWSMLSLQMDNNSQCYLLGGPQMWEDIAYRRDLQHQVLQSMLTLQDRERRAPPQPAACLFCKTVAMDRPHLFQHMHQVHGFSMGRLDNLVMVDALLETLRHKLDQWQCLYCERHFKNPAVLRKHMREKKHFRIHSSNKQYDKYFMIHYIDPSKSWQEWQAEEAAVGNDMDELDDDDEDTASQGTSLSHSTMFDQLNISDQQSFYNKRLHKDDLEWDDWHEDSENNTTNQPVACLFCTHCAPHIEALHDHLQSIHDFSFSALKQDNYDFYDCVRIINFARKRVNLECTCLVCGSICASLDALTQHQQVHQHERMNQLDWRQLVPMKDPEFLFPVIEDDPLLCGFEQDWNE